jgi:regulator of protease activity HflC (stomatin/prohibitin superfamily)
MASLTEILAGTAVEVVIFGVAGGVLYRVWRGASFLPQRRTLLPFNKGVVLEGERVVKVLDSGTYWVKPKQTIVPVDVRPRPFQMPSRQLLTADGQGLQIRLEGEYKVVDPRLFVLESSDGHAAFYLSLDRETARAIGELERAEILTSRVSPADRIRERIEPRAAQLGVAITHLDVSDLIPIAWLQSAPSD